MVGRTGVHPAVYARAPHSVIRSGVGALSCQVCSHLKNFPGPWRPPLGSLHLSSFFFLSLWSPPPLDFNALRLEDLYPSSSPCGEHEAGVHTDPGHVHWLSQGP